MLIRGLYKVLQHYKNKRSSHSSVERVMARIISGQNEETFAITADQKVFRNKIDQTSKFCLDSQLKLEQSDFVEIRNICRLSKDETMEQLIDKWEWESEIEKALKIAAEGLSSDELKCWLDGKNYPECAKRILDVVKWVMCKAEVYTNHSSVERAMTKIIFGLNKTFPITDQKFYQAFTDFTSFFTNDNTISRNYTMREWWILCTRNNGLSPDSQFLFTNSTESPPSGICKALISVVTNSCKFPPNPGSQIRVAAFKNNTLSRNQKSAHLANEGTETKTESTKFLFIDKQLRNIVIEHQFEYLLFPSDTLPMEMPPRPWIEKGACGPLYTREQNILRELEEYPNFSVNHEMTRNLTKDQALPVFDALNDLGGIPWVINEQMFNHMLTAFKMATRPSSKNEENLLKKLSIPINPLSVRIPKFKKFSTVKIRFSDMDFYEKQSFLRTRFNALKKRLVLAKHFFGRCLYFPHNMDFRGRVYPISPHLNHMGNDVNRGLLKFAKGKPLGEIGFQWLKLHTINITGKMKRSSLSERLIHWEEIKDKILDSAERPFDGKRWWTESDDPWQTLAACIELRDAIASGDPLSFVSHLPIHQDGSCNGLQHYAALGRDRVGAIEVNLVPSDKPQDVYTSVAERVEQARLKHEGDTEHKWHAKAVDLRKTLPNPIPRKVVKQTVMTTVYGVTKYGAKQQIKRQLIDLGISPKEAYEFAKYLTECTFEALDAAFEKSMRLKDWFRLCARTVCQLRQSMRWLTPLGLPIVQPYVREKYIKGDVCFVPESHKQINAFPPNFVHSLDSTHMMLTTLHCRRQRITFAAVHDCFWTHACDVDTMNRICREQFIALHKQPLVQQLSQFLKETYLTEELRKEIPPKLVELYEKNFNRYAEILDSKKEDNGSMEAEKPKELNIDEVLDSVYFFS